MIRAAGKARLQDPELELFEAIVNIADRIGSKKRNPLVHDTWGWSDELPDALLRIEVAAEVEVFLAELTGPPPHVAEHLAVEPFHPGQGERSRPA